MDNKNTLYLLDGMNLIFRAFFALKNFYNSKGFPTGAVFGFHNILRKIKEKFSIEYLVVCFDVSRKTFREEKFKEYKINRAPLPDELKIQVPVIKRMLNYLGINYLEKENFEADDLIASLCDKFKRENKIVIISSDKDLFQLLEENILLYNPCEEEVFSFQDFKNKYGFPPAFIIDYLALVGDSIDNIPGAKGIGEKTAKALIQEFGKIEDIFMQIDKVSSRIKNILISQKENILLSKDLIKLFALPLEINLENFKIKEPNYSNLYNLFKELEFKSLLKEIPSKLNQKIEVKKIPLEDLLNKREFLFFYLEKKFLYALYEENSIAVYPLEEIKHILLNPLIKKVSYDFKTEQHFFGDFIEGKFFDVKVASFLIDSSLLSFELPFLVSNYLNENINELNYEFYPYFIFRLYNFLFPKLRELNLEDLFFNVEMPIIDVLFEMEREGFKIDIKEMENFKENLNSIINRKREDFFKIAKKEINLNSPQQLSKVLFEELKLPVIKKTKTGFSTDDSVLQTLAKNYSFINLILDYRHLNKLLNTYVVPLLEEAKNNQGIIYTHFNQTGTQTGRLSSFSPNLQNIPTKGEFSFLLRKNFISHFDYLVSFDYSQIELRILAHFSKEPTLIKAFFEDKDIHRYTASLIFGLDENLINDNQRELAKKVNFGIIYGMTSYGLAEELNLSVEEAENFINEYFLRYPKVKEFIQKVIKQAEEKGFVETILKRKRYLPDIKSNYLNLKEFAKRQAINMVIQGSCADLIKIAMVEIFKIFKEKNLKTKMLLQIHDELIFDVKEKELKETIDCVKKIMESVLKLEVPLKVNIFIGKNWAEMKKYIDFKLSKV